MFNVEATTEGILMFPFQWWISGAIGITWGVGGTDLLSSGMDKTSTAPIFRPQTVYSQPLLKKSQRTAH